MKTVLRYPVLRYTGLGHIGLAMLPLMLTACQGGDKPAGQASAEGEILPGSASDAMLPIDTVRSQPPLAPKPTASGTNEAASPDDEAAAEGDAAEPAGEASAPAPAASTPTAE